MRTLLALALVCVVGALAGCGDGTDPNYKTEVQMSEADKAKEKELMAGQQAPGAAPERGAPASGPGQLTVPGKSR